MNELFALTAHSGFCSMDKLDAALRDMSQSQEGSCKDLLSRLATE